MRPARKRTAIALSLAVAAAPAWSQDHSHHAPPPATQSPAQSPAQSHDHAAMAHDATTPIEPIPPVSDAERAAAFPPLAHGMHHAPEWNSFVLIDRLEAVDLDHGRGEAWEAQAWFGTDLDRLWLRSEGERERGRTESADLEVLYGRSVSAWWDVVAGLKHDFKPGQSRDWLAFGVQGMAPYKFEVSATAYVGEGGATAARLEAEYEVLLTNRLILQPRAEMELSGEDDPERGIGSGLSTLEAGLRLRYEFTRRFAPYVGVAWERAYGGTADHRRDDGEPVVDTRLVAGLRLWF
jgi:copper resistance protein B